MRAKGQHRAAVEHHIGVGAGLALSIHTPAFGNRLAGPAVQFDLATGDGAGGEIEDKGLLPRAGPAKGNGVGAEHRLMPARRRDPGVARVAGQGHQAGGGELLDLHPECGKVHTAIDRQRGEAIVAGLFHQQRQAGLERQLGKPARRVDPHDGRGLVDHPRFSVGRHLAGLQRADATQHPVQAVGSTAIALTGNHRVGHGLGLGGAETVMQQDRLGQLTGLDQGQSDHKQLLGQTLYPGACGPRWLDRFSRYK